MKPLNVALVGAGRWGQNLARNFHALGALHTLCDADEERVSHYTAHYPDVRVTPLFGDILSDGTIDAVAIAAPAALHYTLAEEALTAGKHVYVEKPLCLDVKEGERLIALAAERRRILMVGHLLQYHPCVQKLQQLVADGLLGKLQYITSNRLNLGSIRTEENALWSFAPHDVSVILSLCGDTLPQEVRCCGGAYLSKGVADTTMTTMSFDGDVKAHIYVSWLHPFKEQKLVVVGSAGMAVFDDTKPWSEKLLLYRNYVKWSAGTVPIATKPSGEPIAVAEGEPLREECRHFLECCSSETPPRTDGAEGLRVLQVLQAAQQSLNSDGDARYPEEAVLSNHYIHPTAVVDPNVSLGGGSKVWHFCHLMEGATIGACCSLGQNVVVAGGATLGDDVKVQNNVSIFAGVTCEDAVFLGPSVVFTNVKNPRSEVSRRGAYVSTLLRRGATVGANATIVCGIEVGAYAFIGAGAVVTQSVKPYALVVGNPARQVGWMSRHGERLALPVIGEGRARCPESGEEYRLNRDTLTLVAPEVVCHG